MDVMVQLMVDGAWRDTQPAGFNTLTLDRHDAAVDGKGLMQIEVDSYLMPGKGKQPETKALQGNVEYTVRLLLLLPDTEDAHLMAGSVTPGSMK
jgi:hypothetical protein